MVVAGLLLGAGCQKQPAATGASAAPARSNAVPAAGHLDHAQPKLPSLKLYVGTQEIDGEIARTATEIQTGMMFRTNMTSTEGMLFVFPAPFKVSFYMRNTKVALSCAYIDPDGVVQELHDLQPLDETPVPAESGNIQFVLEMKQGWFKEHGITSGAVIRSQQGALRDTDWRTLQPWRRPQ